MALVISIIQSKWRNWCVIILKRVDTLWRKYWASTTSKLRLFAHAYVKFLRHYDCSLTIMFAIRFSYWALIRAFYRSFAALAFQFSEETLLCVLRRPHIDCVTVMWNRLDISTLHSIAYEWNCSTMSKYMQFIFGIFFYFCLEIILFYFFLSNSLCILVL